jgi:hypothetical protein
MVTRAPFSFSAEERFWKYVRLGPNCWEWTGAMKRDRDKKWAYGNFCLGRGKHILAHRYSWSFTRGCADLPVGMYVCHKCDNPKCIRPDHLFLGTPRENNTDCIAKGRRGKMSGDEVRAARHLYASGIASTNDVAGLYNISQAQAWEIVNRTSRREVQ